MHDKLLIIGAGGHGKVIADLAKKLNRWNYIAFVDDSPDHKSILGFDVVGTTQDVFSLIQQYDIIVGIGNNLLRRNFLEKLKVAGATIPSLVHPNAVIGMDVVIGEGTVVMPGTVINCCTRIGRGCIINTGATIDHDNVIEDYVHLSPGVHLAGEVYIGSGTWLGIGSVVSNNVKITNDCIIGAGTVVINDLLDIGKYVGVPAKRI
jgi:sugar O-acyltransferase (sialic acid O-acetyltransferase NeuD family)